jgi:hypothetical protein
LVRCKAIKPEDVVALIHGSSLEQVLIAKPEPPMSIQQVESIRAAAIERGVRLEYSDASRTIDTTK